MDAGHTEWWEWPNTDSWWCWDQWQGWSVHDEDDWWHQWQGWQDASDWWSNASASAWTPTPAPAAAVATDSSSAAADPPPATQVERGGAPSDARKATNQDVGDDALVHALKRLRVT